MVLWCCLAKLIFMSEYIHAERLEVEIKLNGWTLTWGRFLKVQLRTVWFGFGLFAFVLFYFFKIVLYSFGLADDRRRAQGIIPVPRFYRLFNQLQHRCCVFHNKGQVRIFDLVFISTGKETKVEVPMRKLCMCEWCEPQSERNGSCFGWRTAALRNFRCKFMQYREIPACSYCLPQYPDLNENLFNPNSNPNTTWILTLTITLTLILT